MDDGAGGTLTLTDRTLRAGRRVLAGSGRGWRALLPFAGPAVIASVAYVDPGNFATNVTAGARFGYALLWVVVLANLVAMLFQSLSAKLGIVTGANLAELCRRHFPRPLVLAMWTVSEFAAMATELAELVGGGVGLALLSGLPLLTAVAVMGVATYAMLLLERRGFRPLELVIGGFIAVIAASYLIELVIVPTRWRDVLVYSAWPSLPDAKAVMLAVGIVGATVMPHAIYLHSGLTQRRIPARDDRERRALVGFARREVAVALGIAGLVNLAMVAMAAAAFHDGVHDDIATIETAYRSLTPLFGSAAAALFLVSLLASGLASSTAATMAGQLIMQGFIGVAIPLWLRRLVTMVPAFVVVALGVDPTEALVLSQVTLSLVLPVPLIALIVLTSRRRVMGRFANPHGIVWLAGVAALAVTALNLVLLLQFAGIDLL